MDAMQALEGFKQSGDTKKARRFAPTPALKFSKKGGEYIIGIFNKLKELKESKAGRGVAEITLIDTNATFTVSGDEAGEYTPTPVKADDKVSVFTPTSLYKALETVPLGSQVYIRGEGKVKQIVNGKAIDSYQFDVRHK